MTASMTLIEDVCRLPIDYHRIGTKTLIQLLEDAGYFKNASSVTESDIACYLSMHPDFCDAWVCYFQDRRTDSGWVIDERDGRFAVYYYPKGSNRLVFVDRAAACAAFAIRERESLGRNRT
jgi:hypothetical protein